MSSRRYDSLKAAQMRAANYNKRKGSITGYNCSQCLNRGQIMVVHEDGSTAVQECKCMAQRRSVRILERSGLAGVVKKLTFENFNAYQPWQQRAKELGATRSRIRQLFG